MKSNAKTVKEYINKLPIDRKEAFLNLRKVILENLPKGLEETMSYGMVGYVVPHSVYHKGYHPDPKLPLPFIHLANQKNSIGFYHNGIYADKKLLDWFLEKYSEYTSLKLDIGKSCIRFKQMDKIPYKLIGELISKMSVAEWIDIYEKR